MSSWIPSVKWGTRTGKSINIATGKLTPISRVLHVTFPFGGFVWNHPVAVEVKQGEQEQLIRIVDSTRIAILAMAGIGTVVSFGTMLLMITRRPKNVS